MMMFCAPSSEACGLLDATKCEESAAHAVLFFKHRMCGVLFVMTMVWGKSGVNGSMRKTVAVART
jgi:hypothetical protein